MSFFVTTVVLEVLTNKPFHPSKVEDLEKVSREGVVSMLLVECEPVTKEVFTDALDVAGGDPLLFGITDHLEEAQCSSI